jgi:penicillin-insensitive murein DD-endopeptidase
LAFLRELETQAAARGLRIGRVIIAPEYVPLLVATGSGGALGALAARLTRKPVWVRHDEHFHVEFEEAVTGSPSQRPTARVASAGES